MSTDLADEERRKFSVCIVVTNRSPKKHLKFPLRRFELLGDFNGYYFSDVYPTYLINEPQKKGDDVWQLVFLLDKNRLISSVIVHKNCCYK
jgi:hypothetical protein